MKSIFTSLLALATLLANSQTILQPGAIVEGIPLRRLSYQPTSIPDDGFGTELLSVDNYDLGSTKIYATGVFDDEPSVNIDTLSILRFDGFNNFSEPISQYYQYCLFYGEMVIGAGLSHRTVLPIQPIVMCSAGFFSPIYGWFSENPFTIAWEFKPEGILYDRFDPKLVSYASSKIEGNSELESFPRITGVFNRVDCQQLALEIFDIYPEERFPSHKLLEIPITSTVFINHSIEADRKLLILGYTVDASTSFVKRPKSLLIDLENETWQALYLGDNGNNTEVISGLIDENGICYLVVRETNFSGGIVKSKIVRYDGEGTEIAEFGDGFIPASIIKKTNHGVLIGGDYDRFGLKTAALLEVEENQGLKRMIGYADLGNVETRFKDYEETVLGEMIVGAYDSLNGAKPGSFVTPITHESLLTIQDSESSGGVIKLIGNQLDFLLSGTNTYQVVDAMGRIHLRGISEASELDLSGLMNGYYVISVWNEMEHESLKTVVFNR